MRTFIIFLCLLATPAGAVEQPVVVEYQRTLASQPDQQARNLKVWTIRQTEKIRINLVEMSGELRLHVHPDAAHSLLVLDGRLKVQAGERRLILNKGDFISIPAGTPHKYWSLVARTRLVSMDAPYYDPQKTVVLE